MFLTLFVNLGALNTSLGGIFLGHTLHGRRDASYFEILQSLGCLLAGFLGAVLVQKSNDGSLAAFGWAAVIVGTGCYVIAFAFVRRSQGRHLNFFYYAWLGLLLMLMGTAFVIPVRWLPHFWSSLGLLAAVTGGRYDRWTLRLHSATYLIGAAISTDLPAVGVDTFVASTSHPWHSMGTPGLVVWLLAALAYFVLVATQRGQTLVAWRRLPRFLLVILVLTGAGSLLVAVSFKWLSPLVSHQEAALAAAVRTCVLAITIICLAAASRSADFVELSWLVNPLLVVTGLKLLVEDLRHGTPVSLFLGFTCFGISLILAPRLRRRESISSNVNASDGPEPTSDSS